MADSRGPGRCHRGALKNNGLVDGQEGREARNESPPYPLPLIREPGYLTLTLLQVPIDQKDLLTILQTRSAKKPRETDAPPRSPGPPPPRSLWAAFPAIWEVSDGSVLGHF